MYLNLAHVLSRALFSHIPFTLSASGKRYGFFVSAVVLLCAALSGCDAQWSQSDEINAHNHQNSVQLRTPAKLGQLRAIDRTALFVELAVQYGQTTNIVTATRQNDVDSWEAAVSVPTSTPFTISITWYDMVDPQRLDLVTSTRRFDAITTSGEFSLEVEFDNYDSEAFDADGDSASNLREREDGTLPFDASSPGTQDDDGTADASSPVEQNTVSSRFDSDSEGWVITGDAQGNESTPTFEPQIGDASAHIIANDNQSGGTWYFSAPDKFLGNINNFYGGNVNFELKTSTSSNVFVERDVILTSGDLAISVQLPSVPESEFTTFTVPLIETGWVDSSEEPVDTNMFTFILTNLDSLQIRGEYNVGPDIGGLDNVVLSMIAP